MEARLRTTGRTARLKGFRPGKVPTQVVKQRFGPQIRHEVVQDALQASYTEAIEREKLRPAGSPSIQTESLEEGKDLAYTATFEVYPEFRTEGLDKLAVEKPQAEVTDSDVDMTIERLRRQRGTWKHVPRAATKGDRVVVDFNGTVDGQPMEGGKAEKLPMILGEGRMLADFEIQLEGITSGGNKEFVLTFPGNYHDQTLAGRDARFSVQIHEVAELVLPALDEEFVKGFDISSGDVADMRRLVRENLERDVAAKIQAEVKRQLLDQLLLANPISVPLVMVEREAASLQAESMSSLGIKDIKDAPALTNFRPVAERRVRLGLIIAGVIRDNDLQPDRERVRLKLDQLCQAYERPDEVRSAYLQNAELMSQVENAVMEDQVIDWLIGRARIEPKVTSFAERDEVKVSSPPARHVAG